MTGPLGESTVLAGTERVGVVVVVANVGVGVGVKSGPVVVSGAIAGDVGDDSAVLELPVTAALVLTASSCDTLVLPAVLMAPIAMAPRRPARMAIITRATRATHVTGFFQKGRPGFSGIPDSYPASSCGYAGGI